MTSEDLQKNLEKRVRGFIQDNYDWECFVQDNYNFEMQTGSFEIAVRYMKMVDRYCVPEKRRHDGMSLTSVVHHRPEEEQITGYKNSGETALISTTVRCTSGIRKGTSEDYEYEFELSDGDWFLDQIYLLAPTGRYECL